MDKKINKNDEVFGPEHYRHSTEEWDDSLEQNSVESLGPEAFIVAERLDTKSRNSAVDHNSKKNPGNKSQRKKIAIFVIGILLLLLFGLGAIYAIGQRKKKNDTVSMENMTGDIIVYNDGKEAHLDIETKIIPDCIGEEEDDIVSKLEMSGIKYNIVYTESDKNKGTVINQSIDEGSAMPEGAALTLIVSKGKNDVVDIRDNDKNNKAKKTVIPMTSVAINPSSLILLLGEKTRVDISYSPMNATETDYYFDVDNLSVAFVDSDCFVHAVGTGVTYLYVKNTDGKILGSCYVSVKKAETAEVQKPQPSDVPSSPITTKVQIETVVPIPQKQSATVCFEPCGGWISTTTKKGYLGDELGALPTPSKTGYTFDGWYTSSTSGQRVTSSNSYSSENQTLYAHWSVNSYDLSWIQESGYSVSVSRVDSPYAQKKIGDLHNGSTVYYGDVLNVSYNANPGFVINDSGATTIVVKGNVTSSNIYARTSASSCTYNIKYVSSNGNNLGSTTETHSIGTVNKITPKSIAGYQTPSAQNVEWDSTNPKTITFTYTPSSVNAVTKSGKWITDDYNNYIEEYTATFKCIKRTSNSATIQIKWVDTIYKNKYDKYEYSFKVDCGNKSTGKVTVVPKGTWSSGSSKNRSCSKTVEFTVPVSATATEVTLSCYQYQNGKSDSGSGDFKIKVPLLAY